MRIKIYLGILLVIGCVIISYNIFILKSTKILKVSSNIQNIIKENKKAKIYQCEISSLTSGITNDLYPVFSPNGRQIAYLSDMKPCIMDSDGSNKRFLLLEKLKYKPFTIDIKWSPEGKKILFALNLNCGELSYFLIFDLIARTHRRFDNLSYPDWSPDGKKIVGYDVKKGDICIINLDTEKREIAINWQKVLKFKPFRNPIRHFTWALRNKIYFFTYYQKQKMKIGEYWSDFCMLDINTLETITFFSNNLSNEFYLLSPDKEKFLFSASINWDEAMFFQVPIELLVLEINNKQIKKLSNYGIGCDWSWDSKKVLYQSVDGSGQGLSLFVKDLNDVNQWYLIKGINSVDYGVDWSPDGKKITLSVPQTDTNKDDLIDNKDNKNIVIISTRNIVD